MRDQSKATSTQPSLSPAHQSDASAAQMIMRRYARVETETKNVSQADKSSQDHPAQANGSHNPPFATETQSPTRDALFDLYNRHRPD